MALFDLKSLLRNVGLGPKNVIGVDIGSSSVKICELSGSEKSYKLEKFAIRPLPEGSFFEDEIQNRDEIVAVIKGLVKEIGPKTLFSCIGIWGPNVISKRIQVGSGSIEEIQGQVEWEFEQHIPFDIDEATLSFHIIGENEGGGTEVLVVATKTALAKEFQGLVEDAGLKVEIVDSTQLAIANSFSYVHKEELENFKHSAVLIEFGANSTNIIIYRDSLVVFTREIRIGGQYITDKIQKAMSLNYAEAEELKVNGDQNGNLPEEIVGIINASLDAFLSEIKPALDFYKASSEEKSFQCCYITGGSSRLPGLSEILANRLGIEVLFFNPFERINVNDNKFDDDLLSIISNSGSVSLGLAMRNLKND